MCLALLENPKFLTILLRIDHELAAQCRAERCGCGGALHCANYPRKPRGYPPGMCEEFSTRLSFCCASCRKRVTSMSVRFMGRRVYLALAVVLVSGSRAAAGSTCARLGAELGVSRRTLQRWRSWWQEQFPQTPLWQAMCARFMPPVPVAQLPGELIVRFGGQTVPALVQLLAWLSPLTCTRGQECFDRAK